MSDRSGWSEPNDERAQQTGTVEPPPVASAASLASPLAEEPLPQSLDFREIFARNPVATAVCDVTGQFVAVNPAFEELLGLAWANIGDRTIHDVFDPMQGGDASALFRDVAAQAEVEAEREDALQDELFEDLAFFDSLEFSMESFKLVGRGDELPWCRLAISPLITSMGDPDGPYLLVMIEDITELNSLQELVKNNGLIDPATGLANRSFFRTRMEAVLNKLTEDTDLGVYFLNLNGLGLVNDGLGHGAGDTVLGMVATKLRKEIEQEGGALVDMSGAIARIGGAKFALMLLQNRNTPGVGSICATINESLAEPDYIDGYGIAVTASIGVVLSSTVAGIAGTANADDVIAAADVALREAEALGKRQWALYEPDHADEQRTMALRAAIMPGALEMGDFELRYRPVSEVGEREVSALETRMAWQLEDGKRIDHVECLKLAERSGVTYGLREWLLKEAWRQATQWHTNGHSCVVVVCLSEQQALDPDLLRSFQEIMLEEELSPTLVALCVPAAAVTESEELRDNLRVIHSLGAGVSLHDFQGTAPELAVLQDVPATVVRLAPALVDLARDQSRQNSPAVQAVMHLLPLIHACGARVAIDGITTPEELDFWRDQGVEVFAGEAIGPELPANEYFS